MNMAVSRCPVCDNQIPAHEIERHVNKHFEGDELETDLELAHQIAIAPPSPPPRPVFNSDFESAANDKPESSRCRDDKRRRDDNNDDPIDVDVQICCIISLQRKAIFHRIEGGLITLLKTCLEREQYSTSILSGYIDHFQSTWKEDMGWGCGWRNIQMISSHLLRERPEAREVMFGGSGFVPDIGSLQRWLEIAWQRGFDLVGSLYFKGQIYGSRKWIGTTECAAVLRSFGLRAKIVDFDSKGGKGKNNVGRVYGPMDRFVVRKDVNVNVNAEEGVSNPSSDGFSQNIRDYQAMIDWVWRYFCEDKVKESNSQNVVVTNKMPLYFQHDGHSRTIVGVQVKRQKNGTKQYNLLVLDPGHRTEALEKSLRENSGWQKFLKRGLHTLRKPQYQLCYVDHGIARGVEVEELKTLHSIFLQS